ncbi:energy-coupling factor ABC transporter ATP-binding protein [Nitratifractor sp.]
MIELEGIGFSYGKFPVLRDVSFRLSEGERVVLLGVNGSGKSTLLKILAALEYPSEGSYRYRGREVTRKMRKEQEKVLRREIGILFQNPDTMLFNPSVYEEIAFGLQEIDAEALDERVRTVSELFGISHLLERSPLKLSGGEKQRVAFAAIFAVEPRLLLLDEPTANMDPRSSGWLVDFLQEQEVTTLVATHNLSLAPELGERALVMGENHRLLYDGPVSDLLHNDRLLLEANLLHRHRHRHGAVEHSHYHLHDWS